MLREYAFEHDERSAAEGGVKRHNNTENTPSDRLSRALLETSGVIATAMPEQSQRMQRLAKNTSLLSEEAEMVEGVVAQLRQQKSERLRSLGEKLSISLEDYWANRLGQVGEETRELKRQQLGTRVRRQVQKSLDGRTRPPKRRRPSADSWKNWATAGVLAGASTLSVLGIWSNARREEKSALVTTARTVNSPKSQAPALIEMPEDREAIERAQAPSIEEIEAAETKAKKEDQRVRMDRILKELEALRTERKQETSSEKKRDLSKEISKALELSDAVQIRLETLYSCTEEKLQAFKKVDEECARNISGTRGNEWREAYKERDADEKRIGSEIQQVFLDSLESVLSEGWIQKLQHPLAEAIQSVKEGTPDNKETIERLEQQWNEVCMLVDMALVHHRFMEAVERSKSQQNAEWQDCEPLEQAQWESINERIKKECQGMFQPDEIRYYTHPEISKVYDDLRPLFAGLPQNALLENSTGFLRFRLYFRGVIASEEFLLAKRLIDDGKIQIGSFQAFMLMCKYYSMYRHVSLVLRGDYGRLLPHALEIYEYQCETWTKGTFQQAPPATQGNR